EGDKDCMLREFVLRRSIGSDRPSSGTCSASGTLSEVLMFPASEAFSL
ncbi:hypothetical protein A2U01_0076571, partial [Trifolium medium]|nr:hypothetical protein [Trifolium medium]